MKLKVMLLVIASLTAAQSCIFENREDCPVYLTLDFSGVPDEVGHIRLILKHENNSLIYDTVDREDFGNVYEIPVQKGNFQIAAFGNIQSMVYNNGYTVQTGGQADNLYTCFFPAAYYGDLARDTLTLLKDNIGLHIRILGQASDPDSIYVRIESTSVGYDLNGDIIAGVYRHVPVAAHQPEEDAEYFEFSSRILRQRDENLTLHICAVGDSTEFTITSISLASSLKEAGISMDDKGLSDVYLTVDHAHSSMSVSPVDWNDNGHVEIEL